VIEQRAPSFDVLFHRAPAVTADAPGRVNLIGEHTDYNGGFVLPIATPQRTRIALAPRADRMVRAWSRDVGDERASIEYRLGEEARAGHWGDYIAGVTASLREWGVPCEGFDARIESDLPLGGGLSSSASLEVALLRGLRAMFSLTLDDVVVAKIAQRAETGLVGAPVGIMDQMAASLADVDAALFLDTRSLEFERVPLPPATALIVIHSGVVHRHAGGEYRVRRTECEAAARLLGVRELRDATVADLERAALPPPLDRRARHVVTENARVVRGLAALKAGDAQQFGALMAASHESMRADFEISTAEIDLLVGLARDADGVFGARLTGGGFGGSIVALADASNVGDAAARIAAEYARRVPLRPTVLIP
jgi:galactokinase